jgi:hypothetical protein
MHALFNSRGKTIGWYSNFCFYSRDGREVVAWLHDDMVFAAGSRLLGIVRSDFIYDRNGYAIAFVNGASNGPVTPLPEVPPIAPVTTIPPVKPVPPVKPALPVFHLSWSSLSWEDFLRQ